MTTRFLRLFWAAVLLVPFTPGALAAAPRERLALDPVVGLDGYTAFVGQEFEHVRNGLEILAATENASSGNWRRIKGPLAILAKGTPASAAVWFARPDGSYFTVAGGLTAQNLKSRPYFPRLMAGKEVEGDLVVSKSTKKRAAIIAVPVRAGSRVIGALGVSLAMKKVAALVESHLQFPQGVMFYAIDGRGQIALHREAGLLFEFATQLGSPTVTQAVREMLVKPAGTVHYEFEGAQRTAIFKRSNVTAWVFALRW